MSSSRLAVRRLDRDTLALIAIVVVAAVTRFINLDLMEFKTDEADATRLALHALGFSEPGIGRYFPTAGLNSSIHVPNPPLFIYLIAPALAVVHSPLAAASLVAASNVVAIWLTYLVGKRYYSSFVGITAAALFALSPWGIIFSRKIWAQDTLPIFATLFLLELHAFLVEKRPRALCWLIILAAAATQIHFSAWILAVILLAAVVLGRRTIVWEWTVLGIAGAIALYAPFLGYHARQVYDDSVAATSSSAPDAIHRFEAAVHFMLSISGGGYLSFSLGSQSGLAHPVSLVLGTVAFIGLLAACRHPRTHGLGSLRVLAVVWYLLPLLALTVLPFIVYIHYFIILFPLPFLGMAYVLEWLTKHWRMVGRLALAACLCSFAILDGQIYRTIVHDGGAPGDYGVGYKYKREVAALIERENPDRQFELGRDVQLDSGSFDEYSLLVWDVDLNNAQSQPAATGYAIIDTMGEPPNAAGGPTPGPDQVRHFGPLEVVSVPLK
jgi:Dolichyl-phosphate-mannose-protein mannosyltransferase